MRKYHVHLIGVSEETTERMGKRLELTRERLWISQNWWKTYIYQLRKQNISEEESIILFYKMRKALTIKEKADKFSCVKLKSSVNQIEPQRKWKNSKLCTCTKPCILFYFICCSFTVTGFCMNLFYFDWHPWMFSLRTHDLS